MLRDVIPVFKMVRNQWEHSLNKQNFINHYIVRNEAGKHEKGSLEMVVELYGVRS